MKAYFAQYQEKSNEFRKAILFEIYLKFFRKKIDKGSRYYKQL